MATAPKYFMYFPGNYRWSAAFVNMLGTAPFGGVDMSELHQIGRMLEGKSGDDDEAWFAACITVADIVRGRAEKFRAENYPVAAAPFYLRACHYYQMGERFRTPKDQRALDAYRTAVECFHQFVALSGTKIEIVDVPFEGKKLPGYFVPAQNAKSARPPCVVFFDGLDITKEIQFLRGVPDLVKRGISVLVMDGPGTGEAIRFRGMPLRHDYEKAGSACIDYLENARRRRHKAHRHRRHQPRRLLRAALRLAGAPLRRLHRLGRDLGLLRHLEEAHRCRLQGLDVGARPSHHVDSRRRYARRRAEKARAVPARRRGAADALPVPGRARRGRRADSAQRCASALQCVTARPTRRCAYSRRRRAARSTASAIIFRSAPPPCGIGSRTSSSAPSFRRFSRTPSAPRAKFRARAPSRRPGGWCAA